ncbi:FecR domain-containing protein [Chitinophaga rhizophila]|uniref:FecR domain-containing protein n=1 Tax=Chitinophaga rhizophila TaxID=2866212 RepID=A0ABS7GBE3_9BACT|nr:FecR domain-containing protein [Chitinophaga rhizophila]MBW8684993.1 FecR domain-containing protein [Chitinophaga rhizophila]
MMIGCTDCRKRRVSGDFDQLAYNSYIPVKIIRVMQEINYHDTELLQSIADGNENSFVRFFRAVAPIIYADISVIMNGDQYRINAVLQETFIIIWLHRDKLPHVKDIDAYLRSVTIHECYSYLQDSDADELLPVPQYEEEQPPEVLHYKAYQSLIHDTIMSLPEQRRQIYEMHRLKGMSAAQIATAMQLSAETVTCAINAVHQSVRQCLKDVSHSSVSSRHNNWVVQKTKLLDDDLPGKPSFNEHWLPMASKAMAIDRPIPADSTPIIRRFYSHRLNYLYAAAALIFVIVGPGLYLMVMRSEKSASLRTLSTASDKKSRDTLPDGTRVWLNTGSTVKYPVSYISTDREVEIDGEASFMVAGNHEQPFQIHSHSLSAEIKGAAFNIHSYPTPARIVITALQATIQLRAGNKRLSVHPGQQAELSREGKVVISIGDTTAISAWKREADQE